MSSNSFLKPTSRRAMLRGSATLAGSAFLAQLFPASLLHGAVPFLTQQQGAPPADPVAAFRAQMAANSIQAQKLADNLTLLSGPGGNVVVLNGADGKFVVDTFVLPAWAKFKESLDALSNAPVKTVINTHWHFDHVDNNASLRAAGAAILAHENTKKRMSEAHDLLVLNLHFPASPAEANLRHHAQAASQWRNACAGAPCARAHRYGHLRPLSKSQRHPYGRHIFQRHLSLH
jgi:cyclase